MERVKVWWCSPGRWQLLVIYLGLLAWFVGLFMLNGSLITWNNIMHEERTELQNQINLLELHRHLNQGVKLPEGGP